MSCQIEPTVSKKGCSTWLAPAANPYIQISQPHRILAGHGNRLGHSLDHTEFSARVNSRMLSTNSLEGVAVHAASNATHGIPAQYVHVLCLD
jgi:hypothetical protein